jgi:hypothetical protein
MQFKRGGHRQCLTLCAMRSAYLCNDEGASALRQLLHADHASALYAVHHILQTQNGHRRRK